MPLSLLRSLVLLAACGVLAACGQKGPLTLPKSTGPAASAPAR